MVEAEVVAVVAGRTADPLAVPREAIQAVIRVVPRVAQEAAIVPADLVRMHRVGMARADTARVGVIRARVRVRTQVPRAPQ